MALRVLSLVILLVGCHTAVQAGEDLTALVGEAALLKCPSTTGCGDVHSVRWYRADKKIALLAEAAGIEDTEGDMNDRIDVSIQTPGELTILQVQVDDEDEYRCELTYVHPSDACPSVKVISLRTLMKPTAVTIFDQVGTNMNDEKSLKGLLECTQTSIECKAFGGRPAPKITWKLGDEELADDVTTVGENSDAVTTSRLQLHVERKHHGMKLTCAASSEALDDDMVAELDLDLILLPKDINITGVEHHVVEGSKVTLECQSGGARPAASLVWFNGTDMLPADQTPNTHEEQSDGTFVSLARLWFWTSRYDNGRSFHCESSQLAASPEPTLNASQTLDVHYRPDVSVKPAIVTVNETTDVLLFCEYDANPPTLLSIAWLQNDIELKVADFPDHYEGGNLVEQSLLIKNSSEEDIGDYFCRVENLVGASTSQLSVHVNITFKPEVQLTMSPENFVVESARQNVTLECEVVKGNPSTLLMVNWFLDGELLQQLPQCNVTDENGKIKDDMCNGVIPSQLLLENVTRSFHGNYSCQGQNMAGLGPISNQSEFTVFYEPGPASLVFSPQRVIKGESVELKCSVQDGGRPYSDSFQWYRGTQMMTEIQSYNWTIDPVTLETEANFSCAAVNKAGLGIAAITYIEVLAPPNFITNLTTYTGYMYNSSDISLNCRLECSPLCAVHWYKNGVLLDDAGSNHYSIINNPIPPDSRNDYFESLDSTLVFNMSNWPDQVLDRLLDNAAYTCGSSDNGVGQPINSTTDFGVEFPPENMTVSNKVVSVTEGQLPEKVICSAKGKPDPSFIWLRQNSSAQSAGEDSKTEDAVSREVLSNGYALVLKRGVQRTDSGDLICEASNEHGSLQVTTYLNVMYKPECTITETEIEEEKVLICTANANPTEVTFEWYIEDSNDTIEDDAISQKNIQSFLKLDQMPSVEDSRIFVCIVNNSVGTSEPCQLPVQGSLPWWRWWSRTALLVAAGIGILLILVILLCLIILCICRRRRAASKYNSSVPLDERESSAITIQHETSIVQAMVSQTISPRIQLPTTPVQYSEKSRLVPLQGQFIMPQTRQSNHVSPLAANQLTGRLQADLSQLEASYQATLQAKQNTKSTTSLNKIVDPNQSISFTNEIRQTRNTNCNNNNNLETNDKEVNKSEDQNTQKIATEPQLDVVASPNKWPLKPGVLVHVNSNHSLSPKRFGRNQIKTTETNSNANESMKTVTGSNNDTQNKGQQSCSSKDVSKLGILERNDVADIVHVNDYEETTQGDCSITFNSDRCKNIMKSKKKKTAFSKIFRKIDFISMGKNLKSDEDECLSDDGTRNEHKKVKRTKSNKRALSLVGFTMKDGQINKENKSKGLRGIFQANTPIVVPTSGVVTFRRPPKTNEQTDNENKNENLIIDTNIKTGFNSSTESRGSSNSRKRKKPGQAPGGADKEPGIDNPGVYENLPFHGLQQAPNKPIQMIQPRVVRAIAEQNSDKSPESALEKQLRCNPSFTPRILSCPPYSHNLRPINIPNIELSNTSINTLVPSTSSVNNDTTLGVHSLNSSTSTLKPSLPIFSHGLSSHSGEQSVSFHHGAQSETLNQDCLTSGDEEQKFHSLDAKKDHNKRNEPQFSSMKVLRKRKLDRCYPSTRQIDYIMIDKKQLTKDGHLGVSYKETPKMSKDVIYANFPGLFSPAMSSPEVGLMTNSLTSECMNVSFQNLTDSIQIYENSPADKSKKSFNPINRSDSKTPTPAPRTIKSPPITPAKGSQKTSKEHVYANFCLSMIDSETIDNEGLIQKSDSDIKAQHSSDDKSNFRSAVIPICETPKTLPRKSLKSENISVKISEKSSPKKCHPNFSSLTFPKRTTKSGILFDKSKNTAKEKPVGVKEGKIISSKTPSRASSFNELTVHSNRASTEKELNSLTSSDHSKHDKKNPAKISPSIVDATPKVKPFIVNSILANTKDLTTFTPSLSYQSFALNSNFNTRPRIIVEMTSVPSHSKLNESVLKDCFSNELTAKVIPKQQMLIQPAKIPLQIPNLLPKPIPKIHPVQKQIVRRSQSSVSSKGASEYRQSSKNPSSDTQDGSLVRAKIRELNLRQNTNPLEQVSQKLNRTHPQFTNNNRPIQLPSQKHHSFCYFQPIHSVSHTEDVNENTPIGPLVYKPNKQKYKDLTHSYFDNNKRNHEAESKERYGRRMDYPISENAQNSEFNDDSIDPSHRESLNRLHDLLKRDNKPNVSSGQKKNSQNTYTMNSLNQHKYIPNEKQEVAGFQKKRLVYADLDLEDHDQKYKDKVNSNKKLFSKDFSNKAKNKDGNALSAQRKPRTEYATIKFEEVDI